MKCQMNSNCSAESKNSEIPTDQIEQNKKQSKKKKKKELLQCKISYKQYLG